MLVNLNLGINQTESSALKESVTPFQDGFIRLEDDIYRTGGISIWDKKIQDKIAKSLTKEQLMKLMQLLEKTENKRILFCDVYNGGIFNNQLMAKFHCAHMIKNYKEEVFKQRFFESKWKFLMRVLK